MQVNDDSPDDFGFGRGAHSPPLALWGKFSKVRAGFEHLQGLDLPCSHRVEIQLTRLKPFVLLQQLLRLVPLRIYYFMVWAVIEAVFLVKNGICFGVFKFLPSLFKSCDYQEVFLPMEVTVDFSRRTIFGPGGDMFEGNF